MKVLFSGRFDRPHVGHIKTIQELGRKYDVLVVILDYPGQKYPVQYRKQIMENLLERSIGIYEVVVNKIHFGKITKEEFGIYGCDIYAAGNLEVLKHIESLGINVLYVDRPYDYEATNDRIADDIKKIINKA